jgi:hypothetical protein
MELHRLNLVEVGFLEVPGDDVGGIQGFIDGLGFEAEAAEVFLKVGFFQLPEGKGYFRGFFPEHEVWIEIFYFVFDSELFEGGSFQREVVSQFGDYFAFREAVGEATSHAQKKRKSA